jgi:hypothetical protein
LLKQENRRKFTVITVSIVAIFIGAIILPQMFNAQNILDYTEKRPVGEYSKFLSTIKHPPPIQLSDMYGYDSPSISSANQLSGLSAKIPTYIPSDLELKTIKTRMDSGGSPLKMVTLIYTPKQFSLNAKTTVNDVLDYNGVIILYMNELPTVDKAKWMNDYIGSNQGTNAITIHGQKAIGTNGVPQNGMKSQVIFYDENTEVILFSTGYSESDLMQIAESL